MIVVTGSITTRPETLAEVEKLSLEHVLRSRTEPGCLSQSMHRDLENPLRLVSLEEWADRAALATHFTVPASLEFSKAVAQLAVEPTTLRVYEGERVRI